MLKKMNVNVKLFTTLERHIENYDPAKGIVVELLSGATIKELLVMLGIADNSSVAVSIENMMRKGDYKLSDDDNVNIFSVLGGG